MTGYRLSPLAQADLDEIFDYTVEQWGVRQAETYVRLIYEAVETVAATPTVARSCEDVLAGYWRYPVGSHVIFFRPKPYGIDVMRILHGRMDFERHL